MSAVSILTNARPYVGVVHHKRANAPRDLVGAIGDTAPAGSFDSVMDTFDALHEIVGQGDIHEWCLDKSKEEQIDALDKALLLLGVGST